MTRAVRAALSFSDFDTAMTTAHRSVPKTVFETLSRGAGRGLTAAANGAALDRIELLARAATDVAAADTTTTLLGRPLSMPVLLAPVGGLRLIHPDGAPGTAAAAREAGTLACASMLSGHGLADVTAACGGAFWQQLYMSLGRPFTEQAIADAQHHDVQALIVTVDLATAPREATYTLDLTPRNALRFGPQLATRPRWVARLARDAGALRAANEALTPRQNLFHATWADLEWIRAAWPRGLVVKGITHGDDARRAVDLGADAVVVSNHGGFGLDGVPASISRLPLVVEAVNAQIPVLFDGGVRSATDIVKALALGARAVLIGRYYAAALAVAGRAGVARMLELVENDLHRTLLLLGCAAVADLSPDLLAPR